jgi:hypothetical protein
LVVIGVKYNLPNLGDLIFVLLERQGENFFDPLLYFIQHCLIFRPSYSTVAEDAGIEPKTVAAFGTGRLLEKRQGKNFAQLSSS